MKQKARLSSIKLGKKKTARRGEYPKLAVKNRPFPPTSSAATKISHPVLSGVYQRQRLLGSLDAARKHPIIWISAPAGSGKTTLVANYVQTYQLPTLWYQVDAGDSDTASFFYYMGIAAESLQPHECTPLPILTSEYLLGLPTFTRNYFRQLFSWLKSPSVLVFDNFQDAPPDSFFQEILAHACAEITPGINLIVASRSDPPASLARLRSLDAIALLRWEELQLTEEESIGIAELRHGKQRHPHETLRTLHKHTDGWAAGLVLMLEQERATSGVPLTKKIGDQTVIFDYFANEIFRHTDPAIQEFLLKTTFLPKVSLSVAQQLTGTADAGQILNDLARRNYFTVRHSGTEDNFEYHPLFQAFLANRAIDTYSAGQLKHLKQQSAHLLAGHGNVETAVSLLQQAEDWSSVTRLILEQAPTLASQGRTQTLEGWLQNLPASLRDQNPWLLYWLGVCRLPFNPPEARSYFERAFTLFEGQDDSSLLYRAWSGIIDSFIVGWDDFTPARKWLDIFHSLSGQRKPPSQDIEEASLFSYLGGLVWARFDDPNLATYAARAEVLFLREANVDRRFAQSASLIYYYVWKGEIAKAKHLLQTLLPYSADTLVNPLGRINWYAWKSYIEAITGETEDSLRTINEALALAEKSGVHVLNPLLLKHGVFAHLHVENIAAARELAQRITPLISGHPRLFDAFCNYVSATVSIHEGEIARAVEEGMHAVQMVDASGVLFGEASCHLALAYACAKQGDTERALHEFAVARTIGIRMNSKLFRYDSAFGEALVWHLSGDQTKTLDLLDEALILGKDTGLAYPPWLTREDAAILYAVALGAGIHKDYVRTEISRTKLLPPLNYLCEHWFWPIRLYTLGRFALIMNDKPVRFTTRAQKKPLELLRILLALGGCGVGAAKLAHTLWPDTEADIAQRTLDTTLYRLRKLLGDQRYIVLQDGELTLNPRYCWVDMWAFEHLLDQTENAAVADTQIEKALTLYQGPFLDKDDASWVLALRERLRSKFLRAVARHGKILEETGQWRSAVDWYLRGLEVDHLAEELYRRLMFCYRKLSRRAEALAVYRRCHATLTSTLGIEPAQETKTLYNEIQRLPS